MFLHTFLLECKNLFPDGVASDSTQVCLSMAIVLPQVQGRYAFPGPFVPLQVARAQLSSRENMLFPACSQFGKELDLGFPLATNNISADCQDKQL